jgi:D-glycero-D-manno-heptose 1,7-bisphosphate phosphatase
MAVRHLIVDRDGVLNQEAPAGEWVREPAAFQWLSGALDALELLDHAGVRLSVATNQSGIARGRLTRDELDAVHARMAADVAARGVTFAAVLYCPHGPGEGCACRKPAPGLIQAAMARAPDIDAAETLVVGDDERDLEAARRAGVTAALVRTGKGARIAERLGGRDVRVYEDLLQLARALAARID